jgi:hypothetical protein
MTFVVGGFLLVILGVAGYIVWRLVQGFRYMFQNEREGQKWDGREAHR